MAVVRKLRNRGNRREGYDPSGNACQSANGPPETHAPLALGGSIQAGHPARDEGDAGLCNRDIKKGGRLQKAKLEKKIARDWTLPGMAYPGTAYKGASHAASTVKLSVLVMLHFGSRTGRTDQWSIGQGLAGYSTFKPKAGRQRYRWFLRSVPPPVAIEP